MAMSGKEFVRMLEHERDEYWKQHMPASTVSKQYVNKRLDKNNTLFQLLRICWAELRQAEVVAGWIKSTPEYDVRCNMLQQIGDEMKHYRAQCFRLRQMGVDILDYTPVQEWIDVFDFLASLKTTVERLSAHITHEQWGGLAQEQMATIADPVTAKVYREVVVPDEIFHERFGRKALMKYATTDEVQERAFRTFKKNIRLTHRVTLAFSRRRRQLMEMGWPDRWWTMVWTPPAKAA